MSRRVRIILAAVCLLSGSMPLLSLWMIKSSGWLHEVKVDLKALLLVLGPATIIFSFLLVYRSRRRAILLVALVLAFLSFFSAIHGMHVTKQISACAHCQANCRFMLNAKECYEHDFRTPKGTELSPEQLARYDDIASRGCVYGGVLHIGKIGVQPWCTFHGTKNDCMCPKGLFALWRASEPEMEQ